MYKTCGGNIYPPILQPPRFSQTQARLCSLAYTPRTGLCKSIYVFITCLFTSRVSAYSTCQIALCSFLLSSVSWQSFYIVIYGIIFLRNGLHRIPLCECTALYLTCTLLRDILGCFQSLPCTCTSIRRSGIARSKHMCI